MKAGVRNSPKRIPEGHPLRKLFKEAIHFAFEYTPTAYDREIAFYLQDDILSEFVHIDNLYRIRDSKGKRIEEIAQMLIEAEVLLGRNSFLRELEVHRHIGDFALFITGLFPESLSNKSKYRADLNYLLTKVGSILIPFKGTYDYYRHQGRSSYLKASKLSSTLDPQVARLFDKLSSNFDSYVGIFNLIRAYLEATHEFQKVKRVIVD